MSATTVAPEQRGSIDGGPPPHAPSPPPRSPAARRAWLVAGLIVAVAVVGTWTARGIHIQFQSGFIRLPVQTHRFTGRIDHLSLRDQSGTVTVQVGPARTASVRTWGTEGPSTPRSVEHLRGGVLTITSTCGNSFGDTHCARNYDVTVPATTDVRVTAGTGFVVVVGLRGSTTINAGTGNVTVQGGGGPLRVTTGTGNVTVSGDHSTVAVRTGTGNVAVSRARERLDVSSGTGTIVAHGIAAGSVLLTSGTGNITLVMVSSPHDVDVTSGTGSITIGLPISYYTYQVEATSRTGPPTRVGVATDSTSTRVIRAKTGTGSIIIGYTSKAP